MKYLKVVIAAFLLCSIVGVRGVSAQNETRESYAKVFTEYQQKYREYILAHDKYELSKREYERYQTLSSKENLQKDTAEMLQKRDTVLVYYYRSIVSKMGDSLITMPEERKIEYTQKFEGEIVWLNDHIKLYQASDSPQTLSLKSEEVDTRFKDFLDELYKSLYYISRGKIQTYSERYDFLYNELFNLTEKIKVEQRDAYRLSDTKLEIIYRWFGEIGVKSEEFITLLDRADTLITKATQKNAIFSYDSGMKTLLSAMDLLNERISYAKEIVREIKVAEY